MELTRKMMFSKDSDDELTNSYMRAAYGKDYGGPPPGGPPGVHYEMTESGYGSSGYASRADSIKNGGSASSIDGRHTPDYDEDEDEDEALEALENWMNDDEDSEDNRSVVLTSHCAALPVSKPKTSSTQFQLQAPTRKPMMSSKDRARKASRDLKRELNDTTGGSRRSLKREHLIIKWILRITHLNKDMSIDFADWVQDGTVLSQVMTTLCFNSVERDKYGSAGHNPEEDRIKSLQAQILEYGVESKFLFKMDDILKKKNTPKVIRCLEEVAKLSRAETHIKLDTLITNKLYT